MCCLAKSNKRMKQINVTKFTKTFSFNFSENLESHVEKLMREKCVQFVQMLSVTLFLVY